MSVLQRTGSARFIWGMIPSIRAIVYGTKRRMTMTTVKVGPDLQEVEIPGGYIMIETG